MSEDKILYEVKGLAGLPGEPGAVLVRNNTIIAIGKDALAMESDRVESFQDSWLSPKPIDCHVHLHLGGGVEYALQQSKAYNLGAVRDLGQKPSQPEIMHPDDAGIGVVTSGPGLGASGEGANWLAQKLSGPEEFRSAALSRVKDGAGCLKLFGTGLLDFNNIGEVEYPEAITLDEMRAAAMLGREHDIPVAVHGSGPKVAMKCAKAGVTSLEHGYFMNEPELAALRDAGVVWVPTVAAVVAIAEDKDGRHPEELKQGLRDVARVQMERLRQACEMGLTLAMGTDGGSYGLPHGRSFYKEVGLWLEAGLPPEEVFRAATRNSALVSGLDGKYGVLASGASADLLLCSDDPCQNPLVLESGVPIGHAGDRTGHSLS